MRQLGIKLPIFYINRARDTERQIALESELERHGLCGERITAVEGLAVPQELWSQFFDGDRIASRLSAGEVGCYASHLLAMALIFEAKMDYAVVLEDDAKLSDDFMACISSALKQAPAKWGLLHFCQTPTHAVKKIADLPNGRSLVRCSRIPTRSQGYLVSHIGAKQMIAPRKRYLPFDVELQQPWKFDMDIFSITPAIVDHDLSLESVIQSQGQRLVEKRRFRAPTHYNWTGNPLRTPASFIYNLKKLGLYDWFRCLIENRKRRVRLELTKISLNGGRIES